MAGTALDTQTDLAPDFPVEQTPDAGNKLRKAVFAGFAGTVTFGLVLSGWYLGNRIHAEGTNLDSVPQSVSVSRLEAATTAPPAAPVTKPELSTQPTAPVAPLTRSEPPAPINAVPAGLKSLQPEYYLMVAALGPAQDAKYVNRLKARGFEARLEDSVADQGRHILIGPYETRTAIRQASRKLAGAGILAIEATP